jgi:hypothetical protein
MLALVTMSDSRKTPPPPLLGSKRPTRGQSQDDRDTESFAALREREAQAHAHAYVEFANEEITGKYEGEELAEKRRLRKDSDRVERLEKKHDELKSDVKDVRSDVKQLSGQVGDLRADVAGAVGKIEGQEVVLTEMLSIVKKTAERDHVTFTAKVDVDKAHELADVEIDKATKLAHVEVNKEQQLEPIEARSVRRKAIAKLVGGIFVGAYALYEFLHRVGVL